MSAFSITLDTLSSISSAFSKSRKGDKPKDDGINGLSLTLSEASLRSFNEFATGMRMLHKYSSHISSNVQEITRQNLKLLHSNLKADAQYRKTISQIRTGKLHAPQWAWIPLLSNNELDAGLLYIPGGQSVAPQKPGANLTIRDNALHAPFARVASQHTHCQLYLNLAGNPVVEHRNPVTAQLAPAFAKNTPIESLCLRNSDSFAGQSGINDVHRIGAPQHTCLLLNINLFQD